MARLLLSILVLFSCGQLVSADILFSEAGFSGSVFCDSASAAKDVEASIRNLCRDMTKSGIEVVACDLETKEQDGTDKNGMPKKIGYVVINVKTKAIASSRLEKLIFQLNAICAGSVRYRIQIGVSVRIEKEKK